MFKKSQLVWTAIGLSLVVVGVALDWHPLIQTLHAPQTASVSAQSLPPAAATTAAVDTSQPLIQGRPVRIQLPSLGIDLAVINGYYNPTTKGWTLTEDKAQYAVNTVFANNHQGNISLFILSSFFVCMFTVVSPFPFFYQSSLSQTVSFSFRISKRASKSSKHDSKAKVQ